MSLITHPIVNPTAKPIAFHAIGMCSVGMAAGGSGYQSAYQYAYALAVAQVAAEQELIRRRRRYFEPTDN